MAARACGPSLGSKGHTKREKSARQPLLGASLAAPLALDSAATPAATLATAASAAAAPAAAASADAALAREAQRQLLLLQHASAVGRAAGVGNDRILVRRARHLRLREGSGRAVDARGVGVGRRAEARRGRL